MEHLDDRNYLTPPDKEAVPVTRCSFCCETIYAGDKFYRLDGFDCCEYCLNSHFKVIAEAPDWEAEKADLEHHDVKEW